jgi:high frequency lysogenization protein
MSRNRSEQTIAMAAMFQAATLVDQIANKGMVSQSSYETCINSVFEMSPASTEDIFGGVKFLPHNLGLGLNTLQSILKKNKSANTSVITNYVLAMVMLQQKLAKHENMLSVIAGRLEKLNQNAITYYSIDNTNGNSQQPIHYTHPNVISGLDGIYQDTISTFSFRIKVQGDPRHLQNKDNAAKVRALLFAGIRSAMLWDQVGGKRWHLLFLKSRLTKSLDNILNS